MFEFSTDIFELTEEVFLEDIIIPSGKYFSLDELETDQIEIRIPKCNY